MGQALDFTSFNFYYLLMEEKKGNKFGIVFLLIAGVILITAVLFTLNYFGVFGKKVSQNAPVAKTQGIPINVNDVAVVDARVLYTFQGTIDKLEKIPGGYKVKLKDNPGEYFMPADLNVMQMKSSGQAQVKSDTLKSGDVITFSSVYNLKTRDWVKTYTPEDLRLLQNSR